MHDQLAHNTLGPGGAGLDGSAFGVLYELQVIVGVVKATDVGGGGWCAAVDRFPVFNAIGIVGVLKGETIVEGNSLGEVQVVVLDRCHAFVGIPDHVPIFVVAVFLRAHC